MNNAGIAIIHHPPNHHKWVVFQPSKMGGLLLLYPHYAEYPYRLVVMWLLRIRSHFLHKIKTFGLKLSPMKSTWEITERKWAAKNNIRYVQRKIYPKHDGCWMLSERGKTTPYFRVSLSNQILVGHTLSSSFSYLFTGTEILRCRHSLSDCPIGLQQTQL